MKRLKRIHKNKKSIAQKQSSKKQRFYYGGLRKPTAEKWEYTGKRWGFKTKESGVKGNGLTKRLDQKIAREQGKRKRAGAKTPAMDKSFVVQGVVRRKRLAGGKENTSNCPVQKGDHRIKKRTAKTNK